MEFWQQPAVLTILLIAALLAGSELVRGLIPVFNRFGVPGAIVAGVLGFVLGPPVLGWVPLDVDVLKNIVYHALGVVFIAVSLQTPEKGEGHQGGGGLSYGFLITVLVAMQTVVGLGLVLMLGFLAADHMHPGFGLILPLGFEQGPGQALSLGSVWEEGGMTDGADVGLIVAAIGYAWSVGVGVPLVMWGKAKGLVGAQRTADEVQGDKEHVEQMPLLPAGSLELLTRQLVAIGTVYLATYGVCLAAASGLERAGIQDIAHMIWGFHFMIGALLAMMVRPLLHKLPSGTPLHNGLLGRVAGVTVDFATVAALSAIQLSVFTANLLPILVVTTAGGITTLLAVLWTSRRGFKDAPFEHCVLLFGTSTGTLPMGLALLRIIDPELQSPAPNSAVVGSAIAIVGVAPILLLLHPIAVAGWSDGYPAAGLTALAATTVYMLVSCLLWWKVGGLRAGWDPFQIWPRSNP